MGTAFIQHVLKEFLSRQSEANVVANLKKYKFLHAQVQYLRYVVGRGVIMPHNSNVEDIKDFPRPSNRRKLRRFLGWIGYYQRFLKNLPVSLPCSPSH